MKVLYLIDSLKAYGAEKSIVEIALNFTKITPVFVYIYQGDDLVDTLRKNKIIVYSLDLPQKYNFKKAVNLIKPILEIERPDIIHSTLFRADMIARRLKAVIPSIKLVGSLVSNSYGRNRYNQLEKLSKLKLWTTQLRDKYSVGEVDFFVCNSYAIKESNIKALGIPSCKVKVIYRGRDFRDFLVSQEETQLLKNELRLKNKKIFLNISRLTKSKGQMDLVQAFKIFNKEIPNTILILVGDGNFKYEILDFITKNSLGNKILLLGYREDVPILLSLADFFIFPSYYEGLPGSLIEAIISKTPTIVTNIPENKECLPKNGALYFEPGNIFELATKMKEAISMDNWSEKTQINYDYAQENFEINKVRLEYEDFYMLVCSGNI